MKLGLYIINSPDFPKRKDFKKFGVWCEWHELKENPYLTSLCDSEEEFQKLMMIPYTKGLETYYPVISETLFPERVYLFVLINVQVGNSHKLDAYASVINGEVVSITVWKNSTGNDEIIFYRRDRLAAEDENPKAIKELSEELNIEAFSSISYISSCTLWNKKQICGSFKLN